MQKEFMYLLKTTLIGGVVFLVPVVLTIVVVGKALGLIASEAKLVSGVVPVESVAGVAAVDIVGVLILVLLCLLAGLIARTRVANRLVEKAEATVLWRMPGYAFIKGFTDSLSPNNGLPAMQTVLCRFDDCWQVGFEVERIGDGRVIVYFPDAPNPWAGSVVVMNADRIETLESPMLQTAQCFGRLGQGAGKVFSNPQT